MLRRITQSITIAIKVAILGFEKSYRNGESLDSILGFIDPLTQIPNRKAFERDKNRINDNCSLVMIDIDNLKSINDNNGHLFGDRVLKRLANTLSRVVKPYGNAYRIGGDEFLLIVSQSAVEMVCKTIQNTIRKEDSYTISQGVVYAVQKGIPGKVITQADTALYQSKAKGKDKITVSIPVIA